ncbi:hypothetical protein BRADI_2g03631v3 [Brachypodium distachyon]|uniref:Uncharacterized protein n=2 Tax=Brachypodium distachyon TaxID=15368 RepID=A0A2K2D6Q4_BRADI|nr:hypothetical protein BRADI_2g03631v3 [Brachypodium distachyon]
MPTQRTPPAPAPFGGVTSSRHAKLLLHLAETGGGGAAAGGAVKDLRLRRVVLPASAPLYSSPDCCAAAKPVGPVQIQSTPPPEEAASAAAQDRDRKPMLPRSKLVRDPGSFGYRRLLPFLNQMAKNGSDNSNGKDMPLENKVSISNKEADRSNSGLVDESVGGSRDGAVPMDSVEPLVVKAGGDREMKDCSDSVKEETKIVSGDIASSCKPNRCTRSKFVHHPSSFSYKRMLPFLMENEISSQDGDRAKFQRISEECNKAQVERKVEEITSISEGNDVLNGGQLQSAVAEVSLDDSTAQVPKVTPEEVIASDGDPLSSDTGELTSDGAPASGLAVSEDCPGESNAAEIEGTIEEKSSKSDKNSVEPLVVKARGEQEMKDCSDSVTEETKIVPNDLGSSKLCFPRCTRSKFVHHPGSFSYKRMLPFLMENEISPRDGEAANFQRVSEEKQLTRDEDYVLASGHSHLAISKDSPKECSGAQVERKVEVKSVSEGSDVLNGGQLHSAVTEVSLDVSTAQVQKITQEAISSERGPLSSDKGELTSDGNDVLASGLAVSEDCPEESNVDQVERIVEGKATMPDENSIAASEDCPEECIAAEVERTVEEKVTKSDEYSALQSAVSEVSPHEGDLAEMTKATHKQALISEGDEASRLTSDKAEFLVKEQPQVCDTEGLLNDNVELTEVHKCQSSESGWSDVCSGSPTKTVMVNGSADQHGALEGQDSVASLGLLLDVRTICKLSRPCATGTPLPVEEMSGSGRKVGTPQPCGVPCLEKQGLSPKGLSPLNGDLNGVPCLEKRGISPTKLSPKKGILKRHTRGCKGICMCLDCSMFRLRADRAFEFSRKQMQEADDIIGNLLKEVASLRSLAEKSSGHQGQMEAACQRALRVEEVARERRRQMLMELNSHCKIPGPRVKFTQYVEEKMGQSPRCGNRRKLVMARLTYASACFTVMFF